MKMRILHAGIFFSLSAILVGFFHGEIIKDAVGQGQQVECGTELSMNILPASINFGTSDVDSSDQITEVSVIGPNFIKVSDLRCGSEGFTLTVQTTTYAAEGGPGSPEIPYSNLSIKTTDFTTLYGTGTGVSSPRFNSYSAFLGTLPASDSIILLEGDSTVRSPSQWGIDLTLKLITPAFQSPGIYHNTITFTLM